MDVYGGIWRYMKDYGGILPHPPLPLPLAYILTFRCPTRNRWLAKLDVH